MRQSLFYKSSQHCKIPLLPTSQPLSTHTQLIDISLRNLHVTRQSPFARPFVAAFQRLLRETDIGRLFFKSVAKPQVQ